MFVQSMARAMVERGHEIVVVGVGDGVDDSDVRSTGVRVITLRVTPLRGFRFFHRRWRLYRWLSLACARGRVDLVEIPDYDGMLPFPVRDLRVVVRLHLTHSVIAAALRKRPGYIARWVEKSTLARNSAWIATSQFVLAETERVFGVHPRQCVVIQNPATMEESVFATESTALKDYVLFAGSVSVRKGLINLAHAAKLFLSRHAGLHWVLVGRIAEDALVDKIRDILGPSLTSRVHFLGRLSHAATLGYMQKARAFILLSPIEASPLVVLEAMASGAVVVCGRQGPGPEMIEDGVSGLLVNASDPEDVCEKVSFLLADPISADRIAQRARAVVGELFTIDRCAAETEVFYRRCIKGDDPEDSTFRNDRRPS